jgi:hypothetical protein
LLPVWSLPVPLKEEVDEQAHLGREMAAVRIKDVYVVGIGPVTSVKVV